MPTLKQKALKGILWSSTERFSAQSVQFILGILLARLLIPSDYGLIGMLAIFLAISQTFIDSGFGSALIQKKGRDNLDYSTTFYFNLVVALLCYGLLFFLAPLIAKFYNQPLLRSLTRITGLTIIINALAVVQRTKFTANIDFKTQTITSLSAISVSGVLGIAMAYQGFGVWALVAQNLTKSCINTLLLWIISKWVPVYGFSFNRFKRLFTFGSKLLAAGLLDTTFRNIYLIVIGKFFSVQNLGYYTRAQQFKDFSSTNITEIIQRVTFPVLSEVQDDEKRLKEGYRKIIKLSCLVIFPVMMGLAALSEPLIRIILTEKWIGSAWMLKLLCFAGMWYPIHALNLNILNVKGRSDLFLKLSIIKKTIVSVVLVTSLPFGIKGLIIGQIVSSWLALFINCYYSRCLIEYTFLQQFKDIFAILIFSFVLFITLTYLTGLFSLDVYKISSGLGAGFLLFMIFVKVLKIAKLQDLFRLLRW
jgi:teichuronic acid exporter